MRLLRIMLILPVLLMTGWLAAGCSSGDEEEAVQQTVTVQRGNLTIDITGVGNLSYSEKEDLAFEMDGTVEEVLVEEADSVEEGQVVARLVLSEWEDQLTALEDAVTTAERNVTSKERAVKAAERQVVAKQQAVEDAERGVVDAERDITEKRLSVLSAQINLNNAKIALENIEETSTDPLEIEAKRLQVDIYESRLEDAEEDLEDAIANSVSDAEEDLEDARIDLEDAEIAVEDAEIAVDDAEKVLVDAREALDEAQGYSHEIVAPFAGFITAINVSGGDEIKKGTVAVTLANPDKFEADITVSELDILQIALGGAAQVEVDAVDDLILSATVTHISPTATIQSGVVNYTVKVEIGEPVQQMLGAMPGMGSGQFADAVDGGVYRSTDGGGTWQNVSDNLTEGQLPQMGQRGPMSTANLTEEELAQMEQMMQQRQAAMQSQAQTLADYDLKEGLTVTVSITVEESLNTLLVPNAAITVQGGQNSVQVMAADGTVEQRIIQVGISDYQYTEVIDDGTLAEGEEIIVPDGTSVGAVSSSSQQQRQGGGMMVPGMMGGGPR